MKTIFCGPNMFLVSGFHSVLLTNNLNGTKSLKLLSYENYYIYQDSDNHSYNVELFEHVFTIK